MLGQINTGGKNAIHTPPRNTLTTTTTGSNTQPASKATKQPDVLTPVRGTLPTTDQKNVLIGEKANVEIKVVNPEKK